MFLVTGNVRTGDSPREIAAIVEAAANKVTAKYGRRISVTPASRSAYRMVVHNAQPEDCDFWLALAGQKLAPFTEFVRAIDSAIPDRAEISKIEQWEPRGGAMATAMQGIDTVAPEKWAEMMTMLDSKNQPMLTWGPRK